MNIDLEGIRIPDSKLAREIMELVQDTEPPLLFHHSSRVYYWGALAGKRRGLRFDPELLYAGAMFHDMGLTDQHSSADERFEVDGANAVRDFLPRHCATRYRNGLDRDRPAHYAGHPAAHAPCRSSSDGRCRNGCARPKLCRVQRRGA